MVPRIPHCSLVDSRDFPTLLNEEECYNDGPYVIRNIYTSTVTSLVGSGESRAVSPLFRLHNPIVLKLKSIHLYMSLSAFSICIICCICTGFCTGMPF